MGKNSYDRDDAAEATNSTIKDVSEAWHDARDDAEEAGELNRGSGPGDAHGQNEVVSLDDLKEVADAHDEAVNEADTNEDDD